VNLHLDRLALRVSGISEAEGRRLAQLVGERLAAAPSTAAAGTTDAMHLSLDAQPGEALESMAHRIVTEMLRGLVRTL
jgi:hypothetical protein